MVVANCAFCPLSSGAAMEYVGLAQPKFTNLPESKPNIKKRNDGRVLTMQVLNPNMKSVEFSIRGPVVMRALEIEKELAQGSAKPFNDVIKANIGDCHILGQKPIKYVRQLVALCQYPELMTCPKFPPDVKVKAQRILGSCGGQSVGSYSASNGVQVIRQDAATYISSRDGGIPADAENIVLTNGATDGIREVLKMFMNYSNNGKPVGVMVPVPLYPLYSATIAEYGLQQINYYLNEEKQWALDITDMKRAINEARKTCDPKVLVVINPGNPTGQVLSRENMVDIVKFAYKQGLFILADEVYQDNIHTDNAQFHSFKKVICEMGAPYSAMELASFHSASKGYLGECGQRGAYVELFNMDPEVVKQFQKSCIVRLCPATAGQAVLACMVNPPKLDDESYDEFAKEKHAALQALADGAKLVEQTFNSLEGLRCSPIQGSMFAFPQLLLPQKAIDAARRLNQEPDFFYCMQLLENAGICVIPGNGFGQKKGTYHFRTTILPQPESLGALLRRFSDFHKAFMTQYQ